MTAPAPLSALEAADLRSPTARLLATAWQLIVAVGVVVTVLGLVVVFYNFWGNDEARAQIERLEGGIQLGETREQVLARARDGRASRVRVEEGPAAVYFKAPTIYFGDATWWLVVDLDACGVSAVRVRCDDNMSSRPFGAPPDRIRSQPCGHAGEAPAPPPRSQVGARP